jgi:hypothetical protein
MTVGPGKHAAPDKTPQGPGQAKDSWLKRPLTWVVGFFAATAVAAGTAFGSGLGQQLFSNVAGNTISSPFFRGGGAESSGTSVSLGGSTCR